MQTNTTSGKIIRSPITEHQSPVSTPDNWNIHPCFGCFTKIRIYCNGTMTSVPHSSLYVMVNPFCVMTSRMFPRTIVRLFL